jgi:malate dehydrogenase (oxaloacetate-decarboxylating)
MKNEEKSIYKKDFEKWGKLKQKIDKSMHVPPIVKEGEFWWASLGVNVGSEIDGKSGDFTRPVFIIKKLANKTFLVAPATTSNRDGYLYFKTKFDNFESTLSLNQIKVISYKRLYEKYSDVTISEQDFLEIRNRIYFYYLSGVKFSPQLVAGESRVDTAPLINNIIADQKNLSNSNNKISHDYNQEALEMHRKYGGKLETVSRFKLENRDDLSRAYTPGVAEVCNVIHRENLENKNENAAREYTLKRNTIAVISDGSAILGLGNLGASASIPVMEGKAAILKEFAGVDAFPICLQTQDTEEIIKTIKNIAPVFGGINLEDIAAPKCFEIEERLRTELNIPVMHDDQWGAATVTLTAFINSLKIVNKEKENVRVVLSGVGAAGVATARLLISYGVKNIIFVDSKGVITKNRETGEVLNKEKLELLENTNAHNVKGGLIDAMVGGDVFIGLSKPNVLTMDMIKSMNSDPIIFALANPYPEISVDDARAAGARIVATGRSDYPNQINNSLVFPGFWRGVLDAQYANTYKGIDNQVFIKIAKDLASYTEISAGGINIDRILPNMLDKKCVQIVADSFKN